MKELEKIGLGSVQFGIKYGISNTSSKTSEDEVGKILQYASEIGITCIDTASAYGNAEEVLGNFDLSKFRVVTKFMPPEKEGSIEEEFQKSQNRLNLSNIDGYLAHRPGFLIEDKSAWKSLQDLKAKDKINKIGFSLNHPNEVQQLLALNMIPDLVQVPFNYLDDRFRAGMINLKEKGCEIHTRSTFLQGLFFMNPNGLSSHFDSVKKILLDLQERYKENLAGALLKYVLEQDFVDKVIMGIENLNQLKQNIESIRSAETMEKMDFQLEEKIVSPSLWPKN